MIRQGDVALIPINELPKNLTEKNKILAYGEVTGHHHRFESNQVQVFADEKGLQFVNVNEPSILMHEEHGHLTIPKGMFKVVIQREFDIMEGMRQVMD